MSYIPPPPGTPGPNQNPNPGGQGQGPTNAGIPNQGVPAGGPQGTPGQPADPNARQTLTGDIAGRFAGRRERFNEVKDRFGIGPNSTDNISAPARAARWLQARREFKYEEAVRRNGGVAPKRSKAKGCLVTFLKITGVLAIGSYILTRCVGGDPTPSIVPRPDLSQGIGGGTSQDTPQASQLAAAHDCKLSNDGVIGSPGSDSLIAEKNGILDDYLLDQGRGIIDQMNALAYDTSRTQAEQIGGTGPISQYYPNMKEVLNSTLDIDNGGIDFVAAEGSFDSNGRFTASAATEIATGIDQQNRVIFQGHVAETSVGSRGPDHSFDSLSFVSTSEAEGPAAEQKSTYVLAKRICVEPSKESGKPPTKGWLLDPYRGIYSGGWGSIPLVQSDASAFGDPASMVVDARNQPVLAPDGKPKLDATRVVQGAYVYTVGTEKSGEKLAIWVDPVINKAGRPLKTADGQWDPQNVVMRPVGAGRYEEISQGDYLDQMNRTALNNSGLPQDYTQKYQNLFASYSPSNGATQGDNRPYTGSAVITNGKLTHLDITGTGAPARSNAPLSL